MPSAHSTIRVLCLVLVIAVARNASAGSAPTGSYQSGAANVSRPSEQLLISFTVVNITPEKISNVHVDLRDLRRSSAPYGRRSAISLVPGSPTQVARQIHPPIDLSVMEKGGQRRTSIFVTPMGNAVKSFIKI
jgi:hypothetical protein